MNIKMFKNGYKEYNKIKENTPPPSEVLVMSDGLFITSEDTTAVDAYINKLQAEYSCFAASPIEEEYAFYKSLYRERNAEGASLRDLFTISDVISEIQKTAEKLGIELN